MAWGETKQPKPMKPRTVQDYRNKLEKQMMPELGAYRNGDCDTGGDRKR